MARWSEHTHPEVASSVYGRIPGNYVVWFTDGTAYVGRQSATTNRIRAAINRHPREVHAVQFMADREDRECRRVEREHNKMIALLQAGVPLRNKVRAAVPSHCEVEW